MRLIRIKSDININVYVEVNGEDHTAVNSSRPDKLSVAERWSDSQVRIRKGAHYYPAEIASWPAVRALCQSEKLVILGKETDEGDGIPAADLEAAKEAERRLRALGRGQPEGDPIVVKAGPAKKASAKRPAGKDGAE